MIDTTVTHYRIISKLGGGDMPLLVQAKAEYAKLQ